MAGWGFSEILKNKNLCVTPQPPNQPSSESIRVSKIQPS